jgi:hypothetical protein
MKTTFGMRFSLIKKIGVIILLSVILNIFGCLYYKVEPIPVGQSGMDEIRNPERYIIVHEGDKVWHLNQIYWDSNKNLLSGNFEPLPINHTSYLTIEPDKINGYSPYRQKPGSELHIYVSESSQGEN